MEENNLDGCFNGPDSKQFDRYRARARDSGPDHPGRGGAVHIALMLERVITELRFFLDHEYETDAAKERQFIEKQLAETTLSLEYWENQVPSDQMTLARTQRERGATQVVYAELRKQLELARSAESQETT